MTVKDKAGIEKELAERYPEHAKLRALGGDNQTIGDFLEWLFHEQGIRFSRWDGLYKERRCSQPDTPEPTHVADINSLRALDAMFTGKEPPPKIEPDHRELHNPNCGECGGTGWVVYQAGEDWVQAVPPGNGPHTQRWLALYFDIDMDRLEQEKRQMLDVLREQNERADNGGT